MDRPLIRAYRATVAYDGSGFSGSQIQVNDRTVMGEINFALSTICNHPVRATAASRTDSGVHASGQVIGFRTSSPRTAGDIRSGLNGLLPDDVRITDCRETGFDFHPRYSAVGKEYLYRILRAKELPPMDRKYVLFIENHKPFSLDKLVECGFQLEGTRDFRSFSPRLEAGENPEKTIRKVKVTSDGTITDIRYYGSGFLYQMVRRMVGAMLAIVQGREKDDLILNALENPQTGLIPYNAKPCGLFLERVFYSEEELNQEFAKTGP